MPDTGFIHALTIIVTLIVLEGLLSADNALVLAVLVKHLPKPKQKKALLYGIIGAFFFRFVMLAAASWIIRIWYLCALGAAYLAFIAIKHFLAHATPEQRAKPKKVPGFWKTVVLVELTDVAFAVDSVVAAVALTNQLWLVYIGGVLGIIAMRFAAGGFLKILDRWPDLEHMAFALVGWISVKLFVQSYGMWQQDPHLHLSPLIFWSGMGLIAGAGFVLSLSKEKREKKRKKTKTDPE